MKKCDKCDIPFPSNEGYPRWLRELLDEVTTCTDCLQKSLKLAVKEMDEEGE